jgi:hypothetical protein
MSPSATLVAGTDRYALGEREPVVVPAGVVILELDGVPAPNAVRLDGRRPKIGWNPSTLRATLAVDLTRETGFHEAVVGSAAFLFGTEDAKLRTDGMVKLLDYLGAQSLSWSGAMYFSGSERVLRDLRLDRAWLERAGEEIVMVASAIADRPWTVRRSRHSRLDRGVPDVGATLRLLRQRPDFLEELDGGPVHFEHPDGAVATYAPREMVVRRREQSLDTPGNRRATALVEGAAALARVVEARAPKDVRSQMEELVERLDSLLRKLPFRELRRHRAHGEPSAAPVAEERFDPRYAAAWELHRELYAERHWDPMREVMPEWAYSGFADAIYQRFCGQLLADHLGLRATADLPGEGAGPHFVGERFDLYLDVTPPHPVIRDWRDDSERKARLRPDLVLHERATGRVALMDAKYRGTGHRASSDSLAEVQLYLQAYSRKRVGVLFPPGGGLGEERWRVHRVSDGTFAIYEMPFLPETRMAIFLAEEIDPTIELLLAE